MQLGKEGSGHSLPGVSTLHRAVFGESPTRYEFDVQLDRLEVRVPVRDQVGDVPFEDPVKQESVQDRGDEHGPKRHSRKSGESLLRGGIGGHDRGAAGMLHDTRRAVRSRRSRGLSPHLWRDSILRDGRANPRSAGGLSPNLPPGVALDEGTSVFEGKTVLSGTGSANTGGTDAAARAERRYLARKAKRSNRLFVESGLPGPAVHRGFEIVLRTRAVRLRTAVQQDQVQLSLGADPVRVSIPAPPGSSESETVGESSREGQFGSRDGPKHSSRRGSRYVHEAAPADGRAGAASKPQRRGSRLPAVALANNN